MQLQLILHILDHSSGDQAKCRFRISNIYRSLAELTLASAKAATGPVNSGHRSISLNRDISLMRAGWPFRRILLLDLMFSVQSCSINIHFWNYPLRLFLMAKSLQVTRKTKDMQNMANHAFKVYPSTSHSTSHVYP